MISALKGQLEILLTGGQGVEPDTGGRVTNPIAANRLLQETQLRIETESSLRAANRDLDLARSEGKKAAEGLARLVAELLLGLVRAR